MKNILNRTSSLLTLLILGGLIALFAFSLKQGTFLQSVAGQTQPGGYPGPRTNSDVSSQDPYPAPVTLSESINQESCSGLGKWELYTDKTAGYSLQYPAESDLKEHTNYISISLHPSCYGHRCGGSNEVVIGIRENSQGLSVEDFIKQEFHLDSSPPLEDTSLQNLNTSAKFVNIDGVQALRIEEGITLNKPDIFIPHGKNVIWIYVAKASNMPPHDPPCTQTLKLLDEILNSIELLPPVTK